MLRYLLYKKSLLLHSAVPKLKFQAFFNTSELTDIKHQRQDLACTAYLKSTQKGESNYTFYLADLTYRLQDDLKKIKKKHSIP